MSDPRCNENWHVFAEGVPQPGDRCQCGLKMATEKIGVLEDVGEPESKLVKTELGLKVPPRPGRTTYREHTSKGWKAKCPEDYAECCALIRLGLTNQSELARIFETSRNTIDALMMDREEFAPGEIEAIIERRAIIGVAQLQDKLMELGDKAKSAKDIGGIAIGLTTMHNIKQISAGKPTQIVERRNKFSVADFEAVKQEARERVIQAKETPVLPLPLPEPRERVEVIEMETERAGCEAAKRTPALPSEAA